MTATPPDAWQAAASAVLPAGTVAGAWARAAHRDHQALARREAAQALVAEERATFAALAAELEADARHALEELGP